MSINFEGDNQLNGEEKMKSNELNCKKVLNMFKYHFKLFFNGLYYGDEYVVEPIMLFKISSFAITNIECTSTNIIKTTIEEIYDIIITLERPGFLIGRKGEIINKLIEYMKTNITENLNIILKESDIWKIDYKEMVK